jgi:hypothetical protein
MMRTKALWSFLFCMVFSMQLQGQNWRSTPYQVYGGIALSNYFGDIGGSKAENTIYGIRDLDITRSRPVIVGGMRYFPGKFLALNAGLAMGWVSGSDQGGKNEQRGYNFSTVLIEPSARLEFFPIKDYRIGRGVDRRGMVRNYSEFSAYIFTGAGAAFYHVLPNEQLAARQKRDNISHGLVTMVIPAGLGVKIGLSNDTDLGIELGGRYAFNDFLDGFTNDISTANDIYFLTSVQMVFRLPSLNLND